MPKCVKVTSIISQWCGGRLGENNKKKIWCKVPTFLGKVFA